MAFDRGSRTYYVSDERLRAFRALPVEERLRQVEELALFLRLAREGEAAEPGDQPQTAAITENRP